MTNMAPALVIDAWSFVGHWGLGHWDLFTAMTELDFESDPKLELLTDALRAGPGTPQWRQALSAVEHTPGADEFKALYTARERLASGRTYREVRAGPGFARKVFEAIDEQEATRGPRLPAAANLIAAAS